MTDNASVRPRLSLRDFSLVIALALIAAFFTYESPDFLGARNLSQLAIDLSITGTLALGMLLVLLPGEIDLSVGSGVGMIGGIASVLVFNYNWNSGLALLVGLVAGIIVWYLMGTLIVRQKIPSFIITLGGLLVFRGLFWLIIQSKTVPVVAGGTTNLYSLLTTYYLPRWAGFSLTGFVILALGINSLYDRRRRRSFGFPLESAETAFLKWFIGAQILLIVVLIADQFRGIPLALVILGTVALGVQILTKHTPFGRHLYAIGGNEEAALLSGIPVARTVIGAFAIMGALVALTGFMETAYSGASTTTIGQLMELDAIAACVIGGTSLKGGRGSVVGVLFGALLMATLNNGMTLIALPPEIKYITRGSVLALAVWMDIRLNKDS